MPSSLIGNSITVSPAYGRDYKSAGEAVVAWEEGKDFIVGSPVTGGSYTSKRDVESGLLGPIKEIRIRYNRLRDVVALTIQIQE